MKYFLLAGFVFACTLAAQSNPGAASIEGQVLNSLTGTPLRKATVVLTAPTAPIRLVADTDGEGRFEFNGLPPGTYRLSASRTGFLDRPTRRPIRLGPNDRVTDAEIHLPPQSVIAGHVLDENARQWSNWVDHGQPYWQGLGDTNDRLANLVWGSDGLVYHRDYHGNWGANGPLPNAATAAGPIGLIHWPFHFIYGYVVGNDGGLYVTRSTDVGRFATSWTRVDLARPTPQTGLVFFQRPATVPFVFENQQRMYTFVGAEDRNLWVHLWQGQEPGLRNPDAGVWANQGAPSAGRVSSAASVITHLHSDRNQIYAFVRADNNLHVNFWDAANFGWIWRDLGRLGNAAVRGDPVAVVNSHAGRDPIYIFVRGENNLLYLCHMDSGLTQAVWLELGIDRRS